MIQFKLHLRRMPLASCRYFSLCMITEIGIYIKLHGNAIWQVLLDKGVLVDEIKLYGETQDDEALDESLCENSFSELQSVITKVKNIPLL